MSFRPPYLPEHWPSFHLVDRERQVICLSVSPVACLKTWHHCLLDFPSTTQCKWVLRAGPEVMSGKSVCTDSALSPSYGILTSYVNQNSFYICSSYSVVLNMWIHDCSLIICSPVGSKDDWTRAMLLIMFLTILHSTSRILGDLKVLVILIKSVRWVRKHVWEYYQKLSWKLWDTEELIGEWVCKGHFLVL